MCNSGYAFIIVVMGYFSRKVFASEMGNISHTYDIARRVFFSTKQSPQVRRDRFALRISNDGVGN